jgi:hypothetical protein
LAEIYQLNDLSDAEQKKASFSNGQSPMPNFPEAILTPRSQTIFGQHIKSVLGTTIPSKTAIKKVRKQI